MNLTIRPIDKLVEYHKTKGWRCVVYCTVTCFCIDYV